MRSSISVMRDTCRLRSICGALRIRYPRLESASHTKRCAPWKHYNSYIEERKESQATERMRACKMVTEWVKTNKKHECTRHSRYVDFPQYFSCNRCTKILETQDHNTHYKSKERYQHQRFFINSNTTLCEKMLMCPVDCIRQAWGRETGSTFTCCSEMSKVLQPLQEYID